MKHIQSAPRDGDYSKLFLFYFISIISFGQFLLLIDIVIFQDILDAMEKDLKVLPMNKRLIRVQYLILLCYYVPYGIWLSGYAGPYSLWAFSWKKICLFFSISYALILYSVMLQQFTQLLPDFLELVQDVFQAELKKQEDFIVLYRL